MHFDDSAGSIADSDLEDGELQKMLTSPLYAQKASGKPGALVIQEREVSAQTSHSPEDHRASGKPAALFSPKRNEQRNQLWSSVFGKVNLSNLSGTLLDPSLFLVWKTRFKTQVTTCSDFPSDAMLWIKEVEMVFFWTN